MKFGKYLEAEQVPEWQKMYVDYKGLKRRIKEIAAAMEKKRRQSSEERVSLLRRASTYLGYDSFSLGGPAPTGSTVHPADDNEPDPTSHGTGTSNALQTHDGHSSARASCSRISCDKCNHFGTIVSATPQIAMSMSAGNAGKISATPVDLAHGANIKIPLSAQDSFTETIRRRKAPATNKSISAETFTKALGERLDEEHVFFAELEQELAKVNEFYKQKQELFSVRLESIKQQQKIYDEMLAEEVEAATLHPKSSRRGSVSQASHQDSRPASKPVAAGAHPSSHLRAARSKLKRAMLEIYRGIDMLKNYRILCYTGFIKALKKYQKTANWCDGTDYFLNRVDSCYLATSSRLNALATELESTYVERYAGGSRSKGMDMLRVTATGTDTGQNGSVFRSGLLLGVSAPMIVRAIFDANLVSNERRVSYHHELLQIYGGIFLVLFFLILFSLNMKVWVRAHINYRFIFEVDPRDYLDSWHFLELSSSFVFIASLIFWINFSLQIENNSYICVYVLLGLLLGLFLMPINILYWSSRRWLIQSLWRILLSGAYSVEFRDFFLGDEMCSLTYTFSMILLFGCASANRWTDLSDKCNTTHWWSNAAFLMIPNLLRLLQCIRRFVDSGDAFPHLANGAKYSSTIITVWLASAQRISGGSVWRMLWVASAIINSCFTSLWDLLMDWGLFESGSKHRFLRSELKYERAWLYYVAIVMDVILRFVWITQISPTFFSFGHRVHQSTLAYIAAVLEVLRRISWNFIRVENEHVSNCGQFRATTDIPLPFDFQRRRESASDTEQHPHNEFDHDYAVVKVPPASRPFGSGSPTAVATPVETQEI
ncbi:Signal transduction protein [Dipsacomyces acuminosporus]|nr:Signal transduction protein [Dipsacomyces acuminosporus]